MKGFQSKRAKILLLSFLTPIFPLLLITCVLAQDLLCATCGKAISGPYKIYHQKPYCSEGCLGSALPKCIVCGKPALRYIRESGDAEKIYCSVECLQTTLSKCEICGNPLTHWVSVNEHRYCASCAQLPRCLNCRLPGADNRLADGRHICSRSLETAIVDQKQADKLFRQAREDIFAFLNLRTGHPIHFFLRDAGTFAALVGKQSFTEQGYYQASETHRVRRGVTSVVSGNYTIYVLSALSPPLFRNTVAHELAHDIGHDLYPAIRKKEDVEGFAEYVSALMNGYWGNGDLNQEKVQNQEKEYADAYMKFLKIGAKNGLRDVLGYMERQNRMSRGK